MTLTIEFLPPDHLLRGLGQRADETQPTVRLFFAETTALCRAGAETHHLGPLAAMAFGRALTGSVLLAGLAKSESNVNVQFAGEGPLRSIFVDVDPKGSDSGFSVRGYVGKNPAMAPAPGVRPSVAAGLTERGFLNVLKADPQGRYSRGTVALQSGEIDEDINAYLATSEQVQSAVSVEVVLDAAGQIEWACGVLVQSLPSEDDVTLESVRQALRPPVLHDIIRGDRRQWWQTLSAVLGFKYQLLGEESLAYRCTCTDQRVMAALMATGVDELSDMIAREGKAEVICDFCKKVYDINRDQLQKLLDLTVSATLSHKDPKDHDDN